METTEQLEKLDLLRRRMRVGYEAAQTALEKAEGDVVKALVLLERERKQACKDLIAASVDKLLRAPDAHGPMRCKVRVAEATVFEGRLPSGWAAAAFEVLALVLAHTSVQVESVPEEEPDASA